MTRRSLILAVIASALLSALITSLITLKWHHGDDENHHSQENNSPDFHHWLHENLALTDAQIKALEPIELKFDQEQARLRQEITKAADDLAHEVNHHDHESPAIDEALRHLNQLQIELQKLSLGHFHQMKSELTPEQAQKLLNWTHDSIVGNHSH